MGISNKGQKRYDNFIQVGLELFLQNGYERTSLNDLVRKSGGSLASIYKFFTNKEGLFEAILEKKFSDFQENLEKSVKLKDTNNLDEYLYTFAISYIEIFYRLEVIELSRIVISETYKNPGLGRILYESIVSKSVNLLIQYFEREEIKSQLKDLELPVSEEKEPYTESETLAYKFCALIRDPFYTHTLWLGNKEIKSPTKKRKEMMAKNIVEIFLYGAYKK
ncbi:TetR/AcrR family transcriptional regulator [Campylobacter pinnipediorum]|uniref:HTH tetR-type domain-containing protein n=1 Tax=Campylobacter pinnipediorum subsp. pinnipediorum TaxID=1660067 RepID=A0AAX0LCU5_9BACT|nr:TetR/AcrR family transcriptional regulator [Campylobacter pinnipediorum]AQW80675.1 putative transcriptional regulator, TetR family [Campylobacter pinnipediorum subsp. pinnipediorum]AQW82343.1 putative transcriptional regulator, TetR family [Campylobacter pinnipediorum subsp. pinnipediorum]AQW84014.1 putative transcriptional regulator, TetR family [Campylobacter pinnipediorum subsp. pinnipediorum]OPA76553.1 hypothetical protein BFG05_05015 [Campylobacter pinnipediorum subsp. pinnipediorum]OP